MRKLTLLFGIICCTFVASAQCNYDLFVQKDTNSLGVTYSSDAPTDSFDYFWQFGDGAVDSTNGVVTHVYQTTGLFEVILILRDTIQGGSICFDTVTKWVPVCRPCVVPGDANSDGIVNHVDLLNIGLQFSDTGLMRDTGLQSGYIEQYVDDWSDSIVGQTINSHHADCNGDGVVNFRDTFDLVQNYGLEHPFSADNDLPESPCVSITNDPILRLRKSVDTAYAGMVVNYDIYEGDTSRPAFNTYGLAFTINYDTSVVKPNTAKLLFADTVIAPVGFGMHIERDNFVGGRMEAAFVSAGQQSVILNGKVGTLSIIIDDNVAQGVESREVFIEFTEVIRLGQFGMVQNNCIVADTLTVKQLVQNIDPIESKDDIRMYPNPARDMFTLDVGDRKILEIQTIDMMGRVIELQPQDHQLQMFNTTSYQAGLYQVRIVAQDGVYVKSLLIR